MRIDVLTIFPDYLAGPTSLSLLGRACESGLLDLRLHDLRDHTDDVHRSVDDAPYGGGAGMVMRADVWTAAAEAVWNDLPPHHGTAPDDLALRAGGARPRTILFTPRGRPLDQQLARELADEDRLVLCCGRYEGIDERVHELVATDEVSLGDYVTFGGEVAALALIEAVVRLLPDAMGNDASPEDESFSDGLLEYPHYTRPAEFRGHRVPDVLLSGDHARIRRWREQQRRDLTRARRPELLRDPPEVPAVPDPPPGDRA
jgi:tRNA (guanine37-N1)-methyltransferase